MLRESKRHALEKLINGCGTVVLSDLATVTKQSGQQMKLNVWIAGKKLDRMKRGFEGGLFLLEKCIVKK